MHDAKFVYRELLDMPFKDINQLQQIMRLTGTPPASLISRMPSHEVSSLKPNPHVQNTHHALRLRPHYLGSFI